MAAKRIASFDDSRARTFRKTGLVLAFEADCAATYFKSWAGETGQSLEQGHRIMVPIDADGAPSTDVYGCSPAVFERTYEAVPDVRYGYRKKATVRAYRPGEAFVVRTVLAGGKVESEEAKGGEDDWLVRNPDGELYVVSAAVFATTYEPV